MSDLVKRLNETEREQRWPNRRPIDAATLVVVDDTGGTPAVLMGRRRADLAFMPGHYVFPGGRVDRGDGSAPSVDTLAPATEAKLLDRMKGRPTTRRARALALTAIRETFEETGVLIGEASGHPVASRQADWQGFLDQGVVPALSGLVFLARAITPPRRPRRFDTRFFLASADRIGKRLDWTHDPDDELDDVRWIAIDEAKTLPIPTITSVILEDVETRLGSADGLVQSDRPVPFYHMQRDVFLRDFL